LIRKEDGGQRQLQTIMSLWIGVHIIDIEREPVGNHQLIEEPPGHALQDARKTGAGDSVAVQSVRRPAEERTSRKSRRRENCARPSGGVETLQSRSSNSE